MSVYLIEFVHSTWPSIPKDVVNCENHNHIFIGFHKLTMVNEFVLDGLSSSWTDSDIQNKSNSSAQEVAPVIYTHIYVSQTCAWICTYVCIYKKSKLAPGI